MVFPTESKHPTPSDALCAVCDRQCPEAPKKKQQAYGCHACARIGCWARSRTCVFYGRGQLKHMNETIVKSYILGQFGCNWSYLLKVFNLWLCNERNLEDRENGSNKLMYAENVMCTQKALLADVKIRARSAQSTLEMIRKIGLTGFWASAVNGDGIFMTVSAGERHNYLAIRLSRYRSANLYDTHASAKDERAWIGPDRPSLEPLERHVFGVHVPGYNMRRKIQATDLPCCSIAGIRMCQDCPLCAESDFPCQDALGSSAELVGGFAGRADILYGAIEAQKTNGSRHFHFKLFVQHLHNARNDRAYCRRDASADC
jgi:hypothetical protein